jgi:1-aminocyclopropane-1-carboxylate deaminase/D-cysteine desulfhydrase-like pyridoxal-dependent ACC family enzyme
MTDLAVALAAIPRASLATLPTPLQDGMLLPGGARLLVKRDDLSGLGMGGNKARKLELLCGAALADGADALVTVGAEQSNHARMTAAAGAILGIETHLVLGGDPGSTVTGNRLLSGLFGARVHQPGTDDWAELSQVLESLVAELRAGGRRPYAIPMGGSTEIGALGFTAAWCELRRQLEDRGLRPAAIIHASSTGGTHGGLLAGAAADAAAGSPGPPIVAVAVAKEPGRDLAADARKLAVASLARLGVPGGERVSGLLELDHRWLGPGYATPSDAGDAAIRWAARHGAWVLDRTYSGKGFAGLLGADAEGRFGPGDSVVFWHTGGQPAVFAADGAPPANPE